MLKQLQNRKTNMTKNHDILKASEGAIVSYSL